MIHNEIIGSKVANLLLKIKAIRLQIDTPFNWASGWKSPIYCDNRKILSYPQVRDEVVSAFCEIIKEKYPDTTLIAGVATGGIGIGVLIAHQLGLPFIYVRPKQKGHGLQNAIEGHYSENDKTLVIEDLVSTGMSSLKALNILRENGIKSNDMLAIFTYNFPFSAQAFKEADCQLTTLSDYKTLISLAQKEGLVTKKDIITLNLWRQSPENWQKEKTI